MARAADPTRARAAATEIVRRLRAAGHTAYFAGGCVRDELMGLAPTDYDVATDATPDRIKELFERTAEVGAAFGVVLVHHPGVSVEVATFRSDGPYSDRRRPDSVTFSDARSDACRRDFTINALFIDPLAADPRSRIIDYVGGVPDIHAKLLRAVGEPAKRLQEDHLRALRAVRFAARLGLAIDPATGAAVRAHAGGLTGVSRERIGEELRRMLAHPSRARAVDLLTDLGLDAPVLNGAPHRAPAPMLAALPPDVPYPTTLAAWALDRGTALEEPAIEGAIGHWRAALCLSNDETARMEGTLLALAALDRGWSGLSIAQRKRAAAREPDFSQALLLESIRRPEAGARIRQQLQELEAFGGIAPEPFVTGDDLIQLGFAPGPGFKRLLDGLYDAQLEGRVADREKALELARRLGV